MDKNKYDFAGWATRVNLKCSDGRTITKDAFKNNDGQVVPLVWNHQHNDPLNVLGHALLENRDEGVYAYCEFNDTESGLAAKQLVEHGDVTALSIYANQLKQQGGNVLHGSIREVSLVLAGANPGAFIDSIIRHGEESDEEAIIFSGEDISLYHADDVSTTSDNSEAVVHADGNKENEENKQGESSQMENKPAEANKEKTVQEVWDSLTEEQKTVVYAVIGQAVENSKNNPEGEEETMKQNAFDKDNTNNTLQHADFAGVLANAKRSGSLKDAVMDSGLEETLQHAVTDSGSNTVTYGMADVGYLFPDARNVNNTPDFIARDMEWVAKVMRAAKHLPFSRVKSIHANITMDEARAKGYTKGNKKTEEVFALLKRTTSPTTIYKKQKMDRDDIVDITDFDVVAWLKSEMRLMLDEEIARAALIGDGRTAGSDDKISEDCIRPIYKDADLYAIHKNFELGANEGDAERAKAFIRMAIKSRKEYKGSGNPVLFTTEDILTDCLLLEDANGRVIYETADKLKTALRVADIVTVPVMEGITREGSGTLANKNLNLLGIIVNMADYSFGADKGGAVSLFDDFDIDFNQQKYLIETRCSGALTKPYSAIVIEEAVAKS